MQNVLFFLCKIWPLEWDGVRLCCQRGRERKEFKPVGFNQTSVWLLGDELYDWKRQQFGLTENCAQKFMACCYRCEGTALGTGAFPTAFPLQPNPGGFAGMQCEQFPCTGVLSHPRFWNISPVYSCREILHGCIGSVNVSRDSKKLEKVFHQGCKEILAAGSGVQAPQKEKEEGRSERCRQTSAVAGWAWRWSGRRACFDPLGGVWRRQGGCWGGISRN